MQKTFGVSHRGRLFPRLMSRNLAAPSMARAFAALFVAVALALFSSAGLAVPSH